MPIIFSKGIVEKIIEKIVEKIVYVAVSTARSIYMNIYAIIKPTLPSITVIAHHAYAVSKFVYSFRLKLVKISDRFIINPIKPLRITVGFSSTLYRVSGVKASAIYMFERRIISVTKPSAITAGRFMPLFYGTLMTRHTGIRPLHRVFSNPPPPSRINIGAWSLSIGVRKTP